MLLLLFLYIKLKITMNPLSSKVHFLAQTRQTKRRTNRTGRAENQPERATSFAHAQALFSSVLVGRCNQGNLFIPFPVVWSADGPVPVDPVLP